MEKCGFVFQTFNLVKIMVKRSAIIPNVLFILLLIIYWIDLIFNSENQIFSILIINIVIFGWYLIEKYEQKKHSTKAFSSKFLNKLNSFAPIISGLVVLISLAYVLFFETNSTFRSIYFIAHYINIIPLSLLMGAYYNWFRRL